jgi:hypothetical protein
MRNLDQSLCRQAATLAPAPSTSAAFSENGDSYDHQGGDVLMVPVINAMPMTIIIAAI